MALRRHVTWTRAGRTLEIPSTGQRVYCAQVAQQNVELADGSFAPYVWSDDARSLRYGDVEARFVGDRIEFRREGELQATTRPRLQRRTFRGWIDEDVRVRVERLADEDSLGPIAYARVALVLESTRATARHILVAGGWSRARADVELRAHLPGEYRVVVEHDLGGAPIAPDTSAGAVGHISARGWRVAWTVDEDRERSVRVTDRGLEIAMPSLRRARGQRRPAEQWISPDTYGPIQITGGSGSTDDGSSRRTAGGFGRTFLPQGNLGGAYDRLLYVDDESPDADMAPYWRFTSVDLGGTPGSIDAGTQLELQRTGASDPGGGANGAIRFRCQASNSPATGADTTDATTGRPVLRTYLTGASDHSFPATATNQTASITAAIDACRSAGYSYDGDSSDAILIQCGAQEAWGITAVSYRVIGYDSAHATGTPAILTIVYTPAAPGGPVEFDGSAAGVATTLASLMVRRALAGSAAGVATASMSLKGPLALAGAASGIATAQGHLTVMRPLAGAAAGVATALATLAEPPPPLPPLGIGVAAAEQEINAISHGGSFTKSTPSTDVTISSVNPSTNTFTATASHGMKSGDGAYRFASTGTLPSPLDDETYYYVRSTGSSTFQVALTGHAAVASTPTLVDITDEGSGTHTLVRTVDTQESGSMFVVGVARGQWNSAPSEAPTDNKGNTYTRIGDTHTYDGWPSARTGMYYAIGDGGADHAWSMQSADFDEVTISAVEIIGGRVVRDHSHVERAGGSATITSNSVTTTGPAVLLAYCWGNGNVSTAGHTFTPGDGWTKIAPASREAWLHENGYIQVSVAYRIVEDAGTYTVTWSSPSNEGGQLYLFAIEDGLTRLAGTAAGVATTSASMSVRRPLAGSAAGQATTSASLTMRRRLAGSSAGVATTSASASVRRSLSGTAEGSATTSAGVNVVRALGGTAAGSATGEAALRVVRPLAGTAAGVATTSASLTVVGDHEVTFAGTSAGFATTAASLTVRRQLAAAAEGAATTSASLAVRRLLGGSAAGVATATANLEIESSRVEFAGTSAGFATTSASLVVRRILAGEAHGVATAVASFAGDDVLEPDDTVTVEPLTTLDVVTVEPPATIDRVVVEAL